MHAGVWFELLLDRIPPSLCWKRIRFSLVVGVHRFHAVDGCVRRFGGVFRRIFLLSICISICGRGLNFVTETVRFLD